MLGLRLVTPRRTRRSVSKSSTRSTGAAVSSLRVSAPPSDCSSTVLAHLPGCSGLLLFAVISRPKTQVTIQSTTPTNHLQTKKTQQFQSTKPKGHLQTKPPNNSNPQNLQVISRPKTPTSPIHKAYTGHPSPDPVQSTKPTQVIHLQTPTSPIQSTKPTGHLQTKKPSKCNPVHKAYRSSISRPKTPTQSSKPVGHPSPAQKNNMANPVRKILLRAISNGNWDSMIISRPKSQQR